MMDGRKKRLRDTTVDADFFRRFIVRSWASFGGKVGNMNTVQHENNE